MIDLLQRDFVIIRYLATFSTVIPGLKHLQLDKTVQHFAAFMTRQVCNDIICSLSEISPSQLITQLSSYLGAVYVFAAAISDLYHCI